MDTFLFPADVGLVVVSIMGAVVAFALAAIPRGRWMTSREAKKSRLQRLRFVGIGVGLVLLVVLLPPGGFTTLTVQGDALVLEYDRSNRRDTVPMAEIQQLEWHRQTGRNRKSGTVLRIHTRFGNTYASTPVPHVEAAAMEPRLAARVTITPQPAPSPPSVFFHPGDDTLARW
ncbi:hypothetical protein [Longimicrobium terrae]|uniref:Uncharacterized protein n=1 Tax=Longimicrobium terrae TaxID=1639882 RepID=A0A841GYN5_9BACT|nr:hypothetical protein [Longimicrobium terrae]MBB4636606.1 hypothetical protein [Longimicrobium terrae]MBB6070870.1 hypothetical protein [Longimicrobium terrae]NNC28895.1 hypothetical protein [Longimicrobium terrae]